MTNDLLSTPNSPTARSQCRGKEAAKFHEAATPIYERKYENTSPRTRGGGGLLVTADKFEIES